MGIEAGQRVRVTNDPSVIGVTIEPETINGRLYWIVDLPDGGRKRFMEAMLEPVPTRIDPSVDFRTGRWSAPSDLRRLLTHVRLTGRLSDLVYSMESTNTDFHAYQFKPLIKILGSPTRGLLLADEVGLGKTIEAGLIWTELVARYDMHRLLVVCPKSLQEKWRAELRGKFNVVCNAADAAETLRILKESRDSHADFAVVSTLSGLRPRSGWNEPDEPASRTAQAELARLLDSAASGDPLFDMVVFDEAHHLRNPKTQQHQLAQLVVRTADYKLMLSATPINLKSEDLRAILQLLDPQLFERPQIFDELDRESQPLIRAREMVLDARTPLSEVAAFIQGIGSGDLLRTDRRLARLKKDLRKAPEDDSHRRRAEVAAKLEEMSMLGGLVNRTRRRDVAEIQVRRRPECLRWDMSDVERGFYERATRAIQDYAKKHDLNERFLLANAQRMLASSLAAAWQGWAGVNMDALIAEGDEDEDDRPAPAVGPLVGRLAAECTDTTERDALWSDDRKLAKFVGLLKTLWKSDPKVIVFSSFRRTIDYLEERLRRLGIDVVKLHGSVKGDRTDLIQAFADRQGPCVLLTSEVGGEGLDLQFCRALINYDLPWNPMRVEQRIGRIDRIGQRSPSVEIRSLVCSGTIEEIIYDRLYDRLDLIQRTLGGFEPILGQLINDMTPTFIDMALTPDELAEEVERQARAAEINRRHQEEVEREAAGLIAHGDMVLNRIRNAHDKQRWIQPDDLREYLRDTMEGLWPGCRIDRADTEWEAYKLSLTPQALSEFQSYLQQRGRRVDTRFRRDTSGLVAFSRLPTGIRPSTAEVLNMMHPLVRFVAARHDAVVGVGGARPALAGRIWAAEAPVVRRGNYGLALQRWCAEGQTVQVRLVFAGVDLATKEVLDDDAAEALATALVNQPYFPIEVTSHDLAEMADTIDDVLLKQHLKMAERDFMDLEEAEDVDRRETLRSVLTHQRENEKRRVENLVAEYRSRGGGAARLIPAEEKKLANYLTRIDLKLASLDSQVGFSASAPETLSIALVEVA